MAVTMVSLQVYIAFANLIACPKVTKYDIEIGIILFTLFCKTPEAHEQIRDPVILLYVAVTRGTLHCVVCFRRLLIREYPFEGSLQRYWYSQCFPTNSFNSDSYFPNDSLVSTFDHFLLEAFLHITLG
jgi:hypothetical protein